MTGQIYFRVVIQCIIYPLETGEIEKVLTITEAEAQHSSPCKVSSSKSGAFSFSGKSSFSHGTLIGLLPVAIATVRRLMLLTKVLLSSYPGLKESWLQMVINISSTYYPVVKNKIFPSENGRDT